MKAMTWLLASMLLAPLAAAQDEPADEAPRIRYYTVEVVVFAYAEDVSVGTEVFPPDVPVVAEIELLIDGNELLADDAATAAPEDVPVVPAPVSSRPILMLDDDFSMLKVVEKLELLDAYDPIMHLGWTQAPLPREQSQPIELAFFAQPPDGLTGSFMLYLGRYLHLVVDLALDAPGREIETQYFDEPAFSFGDPRLQYEDRFAPLPGAVRYRIQDDRIFKNGDVRYFDHPRFGVIAKITRTEESESGDEEESAN